MIFYQRFRSLAEFITEKTVQFFHASFTFASHLDLPCSVALRSLSKIIIITFSIVSVTVLSSSR